MIDLLIFIENYTMVNIEKKSVEESAKIKSKKENLNITSSKKVPFYQNI